MEKITIDRNQVYEMICFRCGGANGNAGSSLLAQANMAYCKSCRKIIKYRWGNSSNVMLEDFEII